MLDRTLWWFLLNTVALLPHVCVFMCSCVLVFLGVCIHVCLCVTVCILRSCACVFLCAYMCMVVVFCVYMCTYVHVCVHVCVCETFGGSWSSKTWSPGNPGVKEPYMMSSEGSDQIQPWVGERALGHLERKKKGPGDPGQKAFVGTGGDPQ